MFKGIPRLILVAKRDVKAGEVFTIIKSGHGSLLGSVVKVQSRQYLVPFVVGDTNSTTEHVLVTLLLKSICLGGPGPQRS